MRKRWDLTSRPQRLLAAIGVLAVFVAAAELAFGLGLVRATSDDDARRRRMPRRSRSLRTSNSEFFDQAELDTQLAQRASSPRTSAPVTTPGSRRSSRSSWTRPSTRRPVRGMSASRTHRSTTRGARSAGTTMQAQVEAHSDEIANFTADRRRGERRQADQRHRVADERDNCDALIVSPNTTETLTPAVEQACETGIPVIVFDRGVDTDCPVTFIQPIGGYAFGADAAEFLVDNVDSGGKILDAADPAGRRRARDPLFRGQGDLRRLRRGDRRRRVHRG